MNVFRKSFRIAVALLEMTLLMSKLNLSKYETALKVLLRRQLVSCLVFLALT